MDAHRLALDVPVDHHPRSTVPDVPFGEQVRVPGTEPLRVTGARRALSPPVPIADGEGPIHHPGDGPPQVVAGDEVPADVPQRGLALAVLTGGHHLPDAHVGAEGKEHEQQPPTQPLPGDRLPGRHRRELAREAGEVVGLLEDVEQVDGPVSSDDLGLESLQTGRLGERLQPRHADPRLPMAPGNVHAAGAVGPQRVGQTGESLVETTPQPVDEVGGVERLADRGVVDVAVQLEIGGQIRLGIPPPSPADHPDLPPADGIPQRGEHAELVGDALHSAPLVDDRLPPP